MRPGKLRNVGRYTDIDLNLDVASLAEETRVVNPESADGCATAFCMDQSIHNWHSRRDELPRLPKVWGLEAGHLGTF